MQHLNNVEPIKMLNFKRLFSFIIYECVQFLRFFSIFAIYNNITLHIFEI